MRHRSAPRAIAHILSNLESRGLVSLLAPERTGKVAELVVVNNHYATGEPFAVARREEKKAVRRSKKEPDEEEGLADIEVERLHNMARNQEFLRQLGLA